MKRVLRVGFISILLAAGQLSFALMSDPDLDSGEHLESEGVCLESPVAEGSIDQLKARADQILGQSNVSARREIDVVFELVDRLLDLNRADEAENYLRIALEHEPWNLNYQMLFAEMLMEKGEADLAAEKATLVFTYAEEAGLLDRARPMIHADSLPSVLSVRDLPQDDCCVVLLLLPDAEPWLLTDVQKKISEILNIPVYLRRVEFDFPPSRRDAYGQFLNRTRRQVVEMKEKPEVIQGLEGLGFSLEDLREETKMLQFLVQMSGQSLEMLEAQLEEMKGKSPQWNAEELKDDLSQVLIPYRRESIAYLGITSMDIYAKDYNFLFGWANRDCGVMSYHRFAAVFNDELPNKQRLIKRTLMQCLASIGHNFEIDRCTMPTCARAYPNSLTEHDAKEGTLCAQCDAGFKKAIAACRDAAKELSGE